MQPQSTESAGKIGVINGLRGLAIAGVLVVHLFGKYVNPADHMITIGPFRVFTTFLLTNSFQGVNLFLILSGFVLALPYFQGRRTIHSWADARAFYSRRLRRLGPLYAFCVLISMIFSYPHNLLFGLLMMFTMTFTLSNDMFYPSYNGVLWTLGLEAWFAVVFPLILITVRRFGIWRVFLFTMFSCLAVRLWSLSVYWSEPIANGLPGRLDDFMCGVLLAYLFTRQNAKPMRFGLPLGMLLLFIGCQMYDDSRTLEGSIVASEITMRKIIYPFFYSFSNLGFFFVVDALLRGKHRFLTWCLEHPLLQMTGLMSYSIYVWHFIMMQPLNPLMDSVHLVRYFIMLGLLSLVSYRFIEFGHVASIRKLLPSPRTVRFPLASWFRTSETSDTQPL